MEFEQVLNQKNRTEIDQARRKLSRFLDDIEFERDDINYSNRLLS